MGMQKVGNMTNLASSNRKSAKIFRSNTVLALMVSFVCASGTTSAAPGGHQSRVVSNKRVEKAMRRERFRKFNPANWQIKKALTGSKKSLTKKAAKATLLGAIGLSLVANPLAANASAAPTPATQTRPAYEIVLKEVPKPKLQLEAKVARPQKEVIDAQDKSRGAAIVTKMYEQVRGYLISAAQKQMYKKHELKVYDV